MGLLWFDFIFVNLLQIVRPVSNALSISIQIDLCEVCFAKIFLLVFARVLKLPETSEFVTYFEDLGFPFVLTEQSYTSVFCDFSLHF